MVDPYRTLIARSAIAKLVMSIFLAGVFDNEALTVRAVGASTFKRRIALLLSSCP